MTSGIDPAVNAAALADAVHAAKAGGADMLFTPEMSGLLDRDRARAAGLDLQVSLEAVVGFRAAGTSTKGSSRKAGPRGSFEMSANDRRFLKSLRISADEPAEKKEVE